MDANPEEDELKEKIKHGQKIVNNLLEEYGSLLLKQMQTATTDGTDRSVKQSPIVDDSNTQLVGIDLAMESIQQQVQLALEQYYNIQPTFSTSKVYPTIQNDVSQMEVIDEFILVTDLEIDSVFTNQQVQLAIEQYYNFQSTLPSSEDCSTIQSDVSQMEVANELILFTDLEIDSVFTNQQVDISHDNKDQNEAKLNTTASELQPLFNGILPDDFYLHLISVTGIRECLLSNRLVCSFWNELVLERCHNQKSLKLFETFDNLMEYGELLLKYEKTQDTSLILKSIGDHLIFERLETQQLVNSLHQGDDVEKDDYIQNKILTREKKREASKVLTTIFPTVEQLVLCAEWDSRINIINNNIDIEYLLQFYAKHLTSLSMTSFGNLNENSAKLRAFSFPKLKSLNTFHFSLEDDQLLSLLPQLESLTTESTKIPLETILRTGTQLRELNINLIESVYTSPVAKFSKRPRINSNLRKFSLNATEHDLQILKFISLNLTSLECFKLSFDIWYRGNMRHLHSVTSHLVPLQQLHSLTFKAPVSFFLVDDNKLADIQPLPSVRHLKLLLCGRLSFSMDLFSRVLFTTFPNVEQVLIGFETNNHYDKSFDDRVDDATFAAFKNFASENPNVVQLFRSKTISRFTSLPNAVSPLLGQHRQVYEEYIAEVEALFAMPLCQLATYLVGQEKEDGPNLKIGLQPADRLDAMSYLVRLTKSYASTFSFGWANSMIEHMVECALKYGPSEPDLFRVTSKCVLYFLDCRVVDDDDSETSFLNTKDLRVYPYFERLLNLVEHFKTQQFNDEYLLFKLCRRIVEFLKEFKSICNDERLDGYELFKILLKLADLYETEQLRDPDGYEDSEDYDDYYNNSLLSQIHTMMDDQLKKFESGKLDEVMREFIRSENRVYRIEMARALLRICESKVNYFK